MEKLVLTEQKLFQMIDEIKGLDESACDAARQHQEALAKPPGSLGRLEELAIQLAGITGQVHNDTTKACIAIMSSDNGVVEEGVASAPQSVTIAQTINFTKRFTGVGALAKYFGVDLLIMDMGVNAEIPTQLRTDDIESEMDSTGTQRLANKIVNRKIAYGTKNLSREPAMTRAEAIAAISAGIEAATTIKKMDYGIFGVGEMGIGNTTTSAAILSALTGLYPELTVGKGGGITEEGFRKKVTIVKDCLIRNGLSLRSGGFSKLEKGLRKPVFMDEDADVIDVLARVGGFDIAAMAGAFIGAAICRIPVVIDGYISAVAAMVAVALAPQSKHFMIASHASCEPGYAYAMEVLGLSPMLNLGMRLGEGSGCPLAFKIVEGACAAMNNMATFEEAEINDEYLAEIRSDKENCF